MKKTILAWILILFLLTACGISSSSSTDNSAELTNDFDEKISASTVGGTSESIMFYGDYVLDGSAPEDIVYYDRIIFYPDGRCYVHYINTTDKDRTIDRGYYTYEYSFSTGANKIGIGSTSGGTGNILEVPIMSENRTLLKFSNYALKLVDEQ